MIIKNKDNEIIFEGDNLRGVNLESANLESVNLYRANLKSANLQVANLSGANLSGAKLQYADLRFADLENANLRLINLWGADLRYVKGNIHVIYGLNWEIIMTPNQIQIGCEIHLVDEWGSFTDDKISKMHMNALKFCKKYKKYILDTYYYVSMNV